MSFDDVLPVEDLVNKDLESAVVLGKVIQYSMLVDGITQTTLVLQRAGTEVGAFDLCIMRVLVCVLSEGP